MGTLTVTAKGQITLPRRWLQRLGVTPGQQVEIEPLPDGGLVLRPRGSRSLWTTMSAACRRHRGR